ncbi:carbohydrate porin, partial [Salmonella enterica subsp. enterica serovar Meleagridis]|nr:carbohydrate porin [Salmonella enterica subsp. enterica serovar Meleagridis]
DIHTIHASYLFPNVMDMKNFNIYLCAYASWVESNPNKVYNSEEARNGGRRRIKYFF